MRLQEHIELLPDDTERSNMVHIIHDRLTRNPACCHQRGAVNRLLYSIKDGFAEDFENDEQ